MQISAWLAKSGNEGGEKYMFNRKKLPMGIDSFEKMIRQNFYYVDKTEMITELFHNWGEVINSQSNFEINCNKVKS